MINKLLIEESIFSYITQMGDYFPLQNNINLQSLRFELEDYKKNWCPYNKYKKGYNRFGLSLTSLDGEMSGQELTSLVELNSAEGTNYDETSFQKKTLALKNMKSLEPVLSSFYKYLGRSHIIRLDKGGFFPSHRDSQHFGIKTFRLVSILSPGRSKSLHFIHNNKKINLVPGRLYFLNTRLEHSVFSFVDNSLILVVNIIISKESVEKLVSRLDSY